MNTENKVIVYDDACPMCSLYTGAFIKCGLLGRQGRVAFSSLAKADGFDIVRAKEEIPLLDTNGRETLYGVDSLVYILGQRFSFVPAIMKVKPVNYFFRRLYKMVSFNRRVIIPSRPSAKGIDCAPPFSLKYRIAFIVFAVVLSSFITYLFGRSAAGCFLLDAHRSGLAMLLIAGTGWVLQGATALVFLENKKLEYLGHMCVVMIMGVLLLLPSIIAGSLTGTTHAAIPALGFALSSGVMLWQHLRRVKYIGASQLWTAAWFLHLQIAAAGWAWVLYRDILFK